MPDSSAGPSPDNDKLETLCPSCGASGASWMQFCRGCGHDLRTSSEAARAESGHIVYLLQQVEDWSRRDLISGPVAYRIQTEYRQRLTTLNTPVAGRQTLLPAQSAAPAVPPLPRSAGDPPAPMPAPSPDFSTSIPGAPPALRASRPARATAAASQITPKMESFFQAHGLKLVFALASLLVLFALRSLIAWNTVGAIAIRILPLFLVGLTAMFWAFGERTRTENPWAGFVFHGMATLLIGFDAVSVNRYWLEPAQIGIPFKPMLLMAALAASAVAGIQYQRSKTIPYLHLAQAGAVLTLYTLLQTIRLALWHAQDFHAAPLPLFSLPFLVLADLNFWMARRAAADRTQSAPDTGAVFTLWAHLCIAAIVLAASVNVFLSEHVGLLDFAALAGLTAILYALGAQMLNSSRMTYLSGGLALTACVLWLGNSFEPLWSRFGLLLMAVSAAAYALAVYNSRQASADLADAWRQTARAMTVMAAVLICGQIVFRWTTAWVQPPDVVESVTGAVQALLCTGLLVLLARTERSSAPLYGALASGAMALISLIETRHAAMGAYALGLTLYGCALYAAGIAIRLSAQRAAATTGPASPLLNPDGASSDPDWPEPYPFLIAAQVSAAVGLLIASLLPVTGHEAVWLWSTGTLALGCALFAATAQYQQSVPAVYVSLVCMAYASALTMWKLHPAGAASADIFAPFAIGTALTSFLLSRRTNSNISGSAATPPDPATAAPAQLWRNPLAEMALLASAVTALLTLPALLSSQPLLHPALSLLPAVIAALFVFAGRNQESPDALRILSATLLNLTAALEIAAAAGLTGGSTAWTAHAFRNASVGWILQAWLFWLIGAGFARRVGLGKWSAGLTGNGTAAALATALLTAAGAVNLPKAAAGDIVIGALVMSAAYLLPAMEAARSRAARVRWVGMIVYGLSALYFAAHAAAVASGWSPAISWALFSLTALVVSFLLARRLQEPDIAYGALLPLVLGFALFVLWKSLSVLRPVDQNVANILWLAAGAGAATGYLQTARAGNDRGCALVAALTFSAVYCHVLSAFMHLQIEWYALALLPFTTCLYAAGCAAEQREPTLAAPFRQAALAVSAGALLFCTLYADQFDGRPGKIPPHTLITWTLAAYGAMYAVLAVIRRTPYTTTAASWVLTAAWLHGLLEHTGLWQSVGDLSWNRFSLLVVMPGIVWIALASSLDRVLKQADLARPLVFLSGVLATVGALLAVSNHSTVPEGDTSVFVLVTAAALWTAIWGLGFGEICWHVGIWNLLIGWMIFVPLHIPPTDVQTDIYLLPFGLYLLLIGHRASVQQRQPLASRAWWAGLLLILAPAFLLYWTHAPGPHSVLLVIECAVAALWGFARHIRPYAAAGLGFAALLTAASILGRLPDYAGTFLALGIGVGLFVAGFYALTHQDRVKQWMNALNADWRAWR